MSRTSAYGEGTQTTRARAYARAEEVAVTRRALARWQPHPWPVIRTWIGGSLAAAVMLLGAVCVIAAVSSSRGAVSLTSPPLAVGGPGDVLSIFRDNLLVLGLHALACVAIFIAVVSLPVQAARYSGRRAALYRHARRLTVAFVVLATGFSLGLQSYVIGHTVARVAAVLRASPPLLVLGLLPHALPELTAAFLPLAAWISARRRDESDRLLAAALISVAIAIPILLVAASWEVYVAPRLLSGMFGYPL